MDGTRGRFDGGPAGAPGGTSMAQKSIVMWYAPSKSGGACVVRAIFVPSSSVVEVVPSTRFSRARSLAVATTDRTQLI